MLPYLLVTLAILVMFVWPAWRQFRREEAEAREMLSAALAAGKHEPTTIRPWINPERCMGSGACVSACPERNVLKVIDGKAVVVEGCHCVGHGACVTACPVKAIELRFGSEKRGIDIPAVATDFQTNVPGLYVAGELGGMGLADTAVRPDKRGTSATSGSPHRSRSASEVAEELLKIAEALDPIPPPEPPPKETPQAPEPPADPPPPEPDKPDMSDILKKLPPKKPAR
jgi:NAD-dependent dihydropyrimidine dehydrogenase PreA subunit